MKTFRASTRQSSNLESSQLCYLSPMSKDKLIPNEQNPLIWTNPERMSGAPCFYQTRLPISSLFENLEGGVSIDEWLDAFPSVTREQAIAVLEYARSRMVEPVA
jgi:uncharacterized protein (DUF433 family)